MMKIVLGGWKDGNMLHNGKQLANITHMVIWKIENVPKEFLDSSYGDFQTECLKYQLVNPICV